MLLVIVSQLPASPSLNVALGTGLTVEAWINPADIANNRPILEWSSPARIGAHLWLHPGTLSANLIDIQYGWHLLDGPPNVLSPHTFQHVAVTYDRTSGLCRLFLNGVVIRESNLGIFVPDTSGDLN